jgi:hypothetical protein
MEVMMKKMWFCIHLTVSMVFSVHAASLHVRPDGPVDPNVSFQTIQTAITAANDGDEIIVYPGIYTGDGNRDIDFKGKALILRSKDPKDNSVVSNTIIDCQGSAGDPHRGFVFQSGETDQSILDGLTITKGFVRTQNPNYQCGGAVWCRDGNPTIQNCMMIDNQADRGGAIFGGGGFIEGCTIQQNRASLGGGLSECEGLISDCDIVGNASDLMGGGLYRCDAAIADCKIISNTALYGGGVAACYGSIQRCQITGNGNLATLYGGGLYDCDGLIKDCTIDLNQALYGAGLSYCSGLLARCRITHNGSVSHTLQGGGLYGCDAMVTGSEIAANGAEWGGGIAYCSYLYTNCILAGNRAVSGGAVCGSVPDGQPGKNFTDASLQLVNCTIVDNRAAGGGALYQCTGTIHNSILWNNGQIPVLPNSPFPKGPQIRYSDVQGGFDGPGNISEDPGFFADGVWDDAGTAADIRDDIWTPGDYHLRWDSGCVDRGDPNTEDQSRWLDFDGEPWRMGGAVDIGADEICPVRSDFNKDGKVDMEDADVLFQIWGTVAGTENWRLQCDMNDDLVVDEKDLLIFNEDWLWSQTRLRADFTQDGFVNLEDFAVLAEVWVLHRNRDIDRLRCDMNDDLRVDLEDLPLFAKVWLSSGS